VKERRIIGNNEENSYRSSENSLSIRMGKRALIFRHFIILLGTQNRTRMLLKKGRLYILQHVYRRWMRVGVGEQSDHLSIPMSLLFELDNPGSEKARQYSRRSIVQREESRMMKKSREKTQSNGTAAAANRIE